MAKTAAKDKPKSPKTPPKKTPKKNGRPSKYTNKLADKICQMIAQGQSVRSICAKKDMISMQTFFRWLRENDKFREQYARACEERSYMHAEDIIEIADNATNDYMEKLEGDGYIFNSENVQRSRLRIDTRKWLMSKLNPKVYGDKLDMTTNGNDIGVTLSASQAEQLLNARANSRDS
nr:MAG TPA: Sf6 terminase small subunit gp1, octamer, DNA-binding, CAPS buffer.65A [Caudoviricetes sp.]